MKAICDFYDSVTKVRALMEQSGPDPVATGKTDFEFIRQTCPALLLCFGKMLQWKGMEGLNGFIMFIIHILHASRIDPGVRMEFQRALVFFRSREWCSRQCQLISAQGEFYAEKAKSVLVICAPKMYDSFESFAGRIYPPNSQAGRDVILGFSMGAALFHNALREEA